MSVPNEANNYRTPPIYSLKISDLGRMVVRDKKLIKITGNLDMNNKHVLMIADKKQVLVYSSEEGDSAINPFLIRNGFEFDEETEEVDDKRVRHEALVDFSCLDEFNLTDIHPVHDLVQFVGYKDSTSTLEECKFKAIFFRVIKRTTLAKYYAALNIQYSFINKQFVE
jgi:hypothetical protein